MESTEKYWDISEHPRSLVMTLCESVSFYQRFGCGNYTSAGDNWYKMLGFGLQYNEEEGSKLLQNVSN
jgi:hypothetical protein